MKALFRVPGEPRDRTAQYLVVAALAVLVAAYAACVFLTRSSWAGSSLQDRTNVTFSAQSSDGYPPSPDALAQADKILRKRVAALGLADAEIVVNNHEFTVTATGNNGLALRGIGDIGRLYLRPVIHAIPSQAPGAASLPLPSELFPHGARRIADEKELRQNSDQQVQLLALQFQATRCNEQDLLVGHDDPNRPLVTCSADGTTVYLLDRSILGGDQVTGASALVDDRGEQAVGVSFDDAGARTWAEFTEANIGSRVAYTVDTHVVSAPEIRDVVPDGRTVITGVFTGSSGRELAATLSGGALPLRLSFESSQTEQVSVPTGSTLLRVALIAGAGVVVSAVIGGLAFLAVSGKRRRPAPPETIAT